MAAVRVRLLPILATISLALLMNDLTLSWVEGHNEAGSTKAFIEKAKPLWDEIFRAGLTPEKVLENLTELKTLIEEHGLTEQFESIKYEIDFLISWSQPDEKKCDDKFIKELNSRMREYFGYRSVYDYSKHYGRDYLSLCTTTLLDEMETSVQKIPDYSDPKIDTLEFELRQALPDYCRAKKSDSHSYRKYADLELYHQQLIIALEKFLSRDHQPKLKRKMQEFRENVLVPCEGWLSATDRARRMNQYLQPDRDGERDEKMHHYVNNADICQYISDNVDEIWEELDLDVES